jgi:transposase
MFYGAIDLHSDTNTIGIINDRGERIYKRIMPNDLAGIKKLFDPFRAELKGIVVESTYNWYWLVDGLQEAGYRVHLANTTSSQQYSGLKHTDDDSDAWWLADLLRLGLLKEGHIYPVQQRAVRDLLRKRGRLVEQRTRNIISIENLTSRNWGVRLKGDQVKELTVAEVEQSYGDENLALAVTSTLRIIEALDAQIKLIEKRVKQQIKLSEPYQLLKTVSGIGEILSMTIMLEAGEMSRFPTVGDFSSYCRCVDSLRLSNGKKKGSGNTKNGNRYLSWAFIEAANFAIRFDPIIRRFYQRKIARSKVVVARKAVAHKLARACYYVLRDQVPFEVEKCFGH